MVFLLAHATRVPPLETSPPHLGVQIIILGLLTQNLRPSIAWLSGVVVASERLEQGLFHEGVAYDKVIMMATIVTATARFTGPSLIHSGPHLTLLLMRIVVSRSATESSNLALDEPVVEVTYYANRTGPEYKEHPPYSKWSVDRASSWRCDSKSEDDEIRHACADGRRGPLPPRAACSSRVFSRHALMPAVARACRVGEREPQILTRAMQDAVKRSAASVKRLRLLRLQ